MTRSFPVMALLLLSATHAYAAAPVEVLIGDVRAQEENGSILVELSLLNVGEGLESITLPDRVAARIGQSGSASSIWLERAANVPGNIAIPQGGFARAIYILRSPAGWIPDGAAISIPAWNTQQVTMHFDGMVRPAQPASEPLAQASAPEPAQNTAVPSQAVAASGNAFLANFSAYEPIYAVYGPGTDSDARIQLSFKYQIFGTRHADQRLQSWRDGLHFAYTQRLFWNLGERSSPFRNIDFQPEIFYLTPERTLSNGIALSGQAGLRHESNGRAGPDSRSFNTLYVAPMAILPLGNRYHLSVAPRLSVYVGRLSDNPDIRRYRGNLSVFVEIGKDDGLRLSTTSRFNFSSGKGAISADVSYSLKQLLGGGPNFYLFGQSFTGYGENLLDYDRQTTRFRLGLAIVR